MVRSATWNTSGSKGSSRNHTDPSTVEAVTRGTPWRLFSENTWGFGRGPYPRLLLVQRLLVDELVEHGAVLLVELLHLVDVARHLVHGLDGH